MNYQILQGDNRQTLKTIPDNSIDAIVTDPPYGIDFLGKDWDANTGALETYQECLRLLKPGGHILAFSAARTYHHLAITLEQAGFEIRDQIMWIYSSGFPKSQDVGRSIQRSLGVKETVKRKKTDGYNINNQREFGETHVGYEEMKPIAVCTDPEAKAWEGWGTALKPAHEPIVLARKPIKLSIAKNCQTHGVGALNIDATRIEVAEDEMESFLSNWDRVNAGMGEYAKLDGSVAHGADQLADQMKDISGYKPQGRFPSNVLGEIPDYQKYFYCPKVSRRERHVGFDIGNEKDNAKNKIKTGLVDKNGNTQTFTSDPATHNTGNNHPTMKPIELMKYLIKLVTPPGGTVLDPFNGSGSTGCAAVELGHPYIGCELDEKYVEITHKRIQAWNQSDNTYTDLFE